MRKTTATSRDEQRQAAPSAPHPRLPARRRDAILEAVREQGSVRTAELAGALGVSAMTVQRDLRELAQAGLLRRVFGGATSVTGPAGLSTERCAMCGAAPGKLLDFTLHTTDGARVAACCAHCGLMLYEQDAARTRSAFAFDFLTRQPLDAAMATYVTGSDCVPCCAPSVLPFVDERSARRFQAGFGGEVASFEALTGLAAAHGRQARRAR